MTANRRFPVQLIVSITTMVLVAGLLGFEIWKYYQPPWNDLPVQVRTSMNEMLSSDEDYRSRNAQVTTVTVMHAVQNVFEGQATVIGSGVASRDVSVHIVWDGQTLFWQTDPGAFLFLTLGSS